MIEIIPAPDHVAAFRIAGTLNAQDYDLMIPRIEEKLRGHEEIGVFVDLEDFEDMTGDALKRDIGYGIDKIGELHRFNRAAITTDKQWVKAVTEMADALFPQIEARVFAPDEKDEALVWVARTDEDDEDVDLSPLPPAYI